MVNKAARKRRQHIARTTHALEHAHAEAQRPLDKSVLRALRGHLKQAGLVNPGKKKVTSPCDHTLKETRTYLEGVGVWSDEIAKWLEDYDAFCDCEVVHNVFGYWTPDLLAD